MRWIKSFVVRLQGSSAEAGQRGLGAFQSVRSFTCSDANAVAATAAYAAAHAVCDRHVIGYVVEAQGLGIRFSS